MEQYHRYQQWKKGDVCLDEESHPFVFVCEKTGYCKRARLKLLFLVLLSFISFSFILVPLSSHLLLLFLFYIHLVLMMKGLFLYQMYMLLFVPLYLMDQFAVIEEAFDQISVNNGNDEIFQHEKRRPYTRKWEKSVMDTIDELDLVSKGENSGIHQKCDVKHDVPAVFFSTGGYTGNLYHYFNDGILPLYITSQHFNKKIVFVILEYHDWWISKYENILPHLTEYPIIDFRGDKRTHCLPEAIVGLKIHDELTINASLMGRNKTIRDFRDMLDEAYLPRIRGLIQEEMIEEKRDLKKPEVVIIARNDSRAILNEDLLVKMAENIGFQVEVLRPQRTTELAKIYRSLNSSDVMIGVHGAAMTHFLFMRPDSAFIQIIPLGTVWAADTYYGQPAVKLGLKYIGYKILPQESSLYNEYEKSDPVLMDPDSEQQRMGVHKKDLP
ncbi:hypothetical protein K7X08_007517 [Anisodus acutangulus]|uniref:Glycosyltransferase 61 catalytic domain-containing protein n=1 Tax=Anisodus acutangulus TaxID=402998 RepID=A0A9Q1LG10_9SOLA|nr:hypothetical protein K7X08_007517 [Anisodus acutangulus]